MGGIGGEFAGWICVMWTKEGRGWVGCLGRGSVRLAARARHSETSPFHPSSLLAHGPPFPLYASRACASCSQRIILRTLSTARACLCRQGARGDDTTLVECAWLWLTMRVARLRR